MESDVSEAYYRRFLNQWRRVARRPWTPRTPGTPATPRTPLTPNSHHTTVTTAMTRGRLTEIDGMDSSKINNFPFSSFKLLGYMQMALGGVCLLLGIVDLFLYLYASNFNDNTLSALTIASVPIWCGLWFIVTGAMGSCMTLNNKTTLTYFKSTFLVLSIVCAVFFGPVLLGIEIYIVALRTELGSAVYEWLIPLLIAFFGFNEIVCAIITAAICCCCSPLENAKVRVLYTQSLDELREPGDEKRRLATPEIFYTEQARTRREIVEPRRPREPPQRWVNEQYNTHYNKDSLVVAKPESFARKEPSQPEQYARHEPARPEQYARNEQPAKAEPVRNEPIRHEVDDEPDVDSNRRQPRVALSDDSPPHYTAPPTFDGNQYRKFKQLMIPGTAGGNGEF